MEKQQEKTVKFKDTFLISAIISFGIEPFGKQIEEDGNVYFYFPKNKDVYNIYTLFKIGKLRVNLIPYINTYKTILNEIKEMITEKNKKSKKTVKRTENE